MSMLNRVKMNWLNYISIGLILLGVLGLVGVLPFLKGQMWINIGLIVAGVLVDLSMAGRLRKKPE